VKVGLGQCATVHWIERAQNHDTGALMHRHRHFFSLGGKVAHWLHLSVVMRKLALLVLASCGPFSTAPLTECQKQTLGQTVMIDFGEFLTAGYNGASFSNTSVGTSVRFSAREFGGRLQGSLHQPLTPGALPRTVDPTGTCPLPDLLQWRADADGSLHPMSGNLNAAGIDRSDGGTTLTLSFSSLKLTDDAGVTASITDATLALPLTDGGSP
jgi:hypothetical protein